MNIDFPFHFDSRGRVATTGYDEHIRDMLEQLLFTNPGERVNRPEFGSGLLQLIHSPNSPELAATLQYAMQADLNRWLGDVIEVQALEATSEASTLYLRVQYLVRRNNELRTAEFTRTIPR